MPGCNLVHQYRVPTAENQHLPAPILNLPKEIILAIFDYLNLRDLNSASLVAKGWKTIASHTTLWKSVQSIIKLDLLHPQTSPWLPMPKNWGLNRREGVLEISYVDKQIVALSPVFYQQSSKIFSFASGIPFSEDHVFLAECQGLLLFTTPSLTPATTGLKVDLKPLQSYKLIALNLQDSKKNWEYSFLKKDLPSNEDNLSNCQIESCFPFSNDNIAVLTADHKLSFLKVTDQGPSCTKEILLELAKGDQIIQVSHYLILGSKILNLKDCSWSNHPFAFHNQKIKTFGSSICCYSSNPDKRVDYFNINDEGFLEKKWSFCFKNSFDSMDEDEPFINHWINDMNEKFILLTQLRDGELSLMIWDTNGSLIHVIKNFEVDLIAYNDLHSYSIFAHLSGEVVIYKNRKDPEINFFHISTLKYIHKFNWRLQIWDWALSFGDGLIQDLRYSQGKLTILLSADHKFLRANPGQYRLIQFDTQAEEQKNIGLLHRISLIPQTLYHALPINFWRFF